MFYITEEDLLSLDKLPTEDDVYSYVTMEFSAKEDYKLDITYDINYTQKKKNLYHYLVIMYKYQENEIKFGSKEIAVKYYFDNYEEILDTDIVVME